MNSDWKWWADTFSMARTAVAMVFFENGSLTLAKRKRSVVTMAE